MDIGIIGAGPIGGAVARLARAAGCTVRIANSRGPATLVDFAARIDVRAVTAAEAATASDIVILSTPPAALDTLAAVFAATPTSAAVVDTLNYYPATRDRPIPQIDAGLLESEWVAQVIGRPVVKAFNMLKANSVEQLGAAPGTPGRLAIALAGDDADTKAKVARLIDDMGFDPLDAGNLSESWRFQPGTLGYCHDYDRLTLSAALAATEAGRADDYRRAADAFATELVRRLGSIDAVGRARS